MKILLLSLYYHPEPVAKPHDLACELVKLGFNVMVITGLPNYPAGKIYPSFSGRVWQWETLDGVRILRVPHIIDRSHSAFRRLISYLSFTLMASFAGLFRIEKPDIIWTYQIGLPGVIVSLVRRSRLIHEVQDLWPEWGHSAGMGLRSWSYKLLDWQERLIYKCSHAVTTISKGFCGALISKNVPRSKITILPNWANEQNFQPVPVDEALAIHEGMASRFNVVYGGNIGSAQALDVVIPAAERLVDCPAIQFVIIGDGIDRGNLERTVQSKGLSNIRFLGSRSPEQMAAYYALADVLLIHLKDDPQISITIPSKTYAYLASQKPILAAARGDVAELIEDIGAGIVCAPQDPSALERTIRRFYAMPLEERQKMGYAGRQAFLSRFTRQVLVQRYQSLFENLITTR